MKTTNGTRNGERNGVRNLALLFQTVAIYFISFHLIIKVFIILKRLNKLSFHIISDCSLGQFKSAKLKDKEYTINAPIFYNFAKKKEMDAPNF